MTDGSGFPKSPYGGEPAPPPLQPASRAPLQAVGVTLIVYNAVTAVSCLFTVVLVGMAPEFLAELAKRDPKAQPVVDMYLHMLPWVSAQHWIGLVFSVIALVGSICLLRGRMYGLAMTGAIVTMLNPGGACCCLVGTALGVWGLVVLMKPEAQAAFNRP